MDSSDVVVAVCERTSGVSATIVMKGLAPYRFRATSERDFARQLSNLLEAMGVTKILEVCPRDAWSDGEEVITIETVLSEIENGDDDWAATHLDELFEAGEIDRVTYARIEGKL